MGGGAERGRRIQVEGTTRITRCPALDIGLIRRAMSDISHSGTVRIRDGDKSEARGLQLPLPTTIFHLTTEHLSVQRLFTALNLGGVEAG